MAEFSKYAAHSIGRLFLHNNRTSNDGVTHSNENIDNERTVYNYHLKKGSVDELNERLSNLFVMFKKAETTVLGEMIVTLPKDTKKEDERDFFQAVYDFYCADFGEENIINAVVHKDEKTPHIHIDFVPALKGAPQFTSVQGRKAIENWKLAHNGDPPAERLCCKGLINRAYLVKMHPRLSEFVKDSIGYEVEILNGATANGNKTVLQLKAETLQKDIERLENQKAHLGGEVNSMLTLAQRHGVGEYDIGLYPLLQKIEELERQNEILRSIIARQGYAWKSEDLLAMQGQKYVPARSVPVNIYDGSLVNADIEKNAVIVIELPDQVPRSSPQKKLIDSDPDLERNARFVQSTDKQVMCRQSRTGDKIYLFIKTDNSRQTMDNLLLMERLLREIDLTNRKVYMDRMSTDTYDLARSIFVKNQIETLYFANREATEKNKDTEQSVVQEL